MANIICADDEPYMQRLYANILGMRGHQVRLCPNGQSAIEAYAAEPADLVLLDLIMPDLSGMDTCRALRKRDDAVTVPILIVSGVDSEQSIMECLSCGADDYILKPFNPAELLAKVTMALRRSSERAGLKGFSPGMVFAGRYEIVRSVGSGGFSTVFEAKDQTAEITVALKVFEWPPNTRKDPKFVSAFLRESYELSKLTHPNIVKFLDFGQHGPYYYMVMEYLDGQTLDDLVEKQGALSEESVILVGVEVARALGYLHNHRIIHRDIKPSNIMITRDGDVKLLDFGLAKQITDTTLRMDDEIRATPLFAAPECFRENEPPDVKSDVYSLGVTLYFAATQSNPFEGDTVMAIIANHFRRQVPPLQKVVPGMGEPISRLISQMLAKLKDDRPTVVELVRRLSVMLGSTHHQPR